MTAQRRSASGQSIHSSGNINYIKEMLSQLRAVAEDERCDMLCYLLEMAYMEASEMEAARRQLTIQGRQ